MSTTQFQLILFYAVTIHKCQGQGLSLDCAIIDYSSKVFLSYVALPRVKTLSGLHLVAFEDTSIRVIALHQGNQQS